MSVIRRRRLYEDIAQLVEKRIRDETIGAGALLPSERDLMREYGVGRPAVREALFHLSKMGLIELRSGERARVAEPTPKIVLDQLSGAARHFLAGRDGMRHFQEVREFLECGLARHAAEHATPAELENISRTLAANRRSIGDVTRFGETDVAFHYSLAAITRNPIFPAIHEALFAWLMDQRTITLHSPGQMRIAYVAHMAIYDAIVGRDPERAEKEMRGHLEQVATLYAALVGKRQ